MTAPALLPTAPIPAFQAYNIDLPGGLHTRPGEPLWRDTDQCRAIMRTLDLVFPGDKRGRRIADLGCLEGGYALEFARAGFDTLGIEGRRSNLDCCDYVAARSGLPNLRFVQDDVRNLERHGMFDAIFCCGLLYHLDRPVDFLHLVGRCTRRVLILQTHFATDPNPPAFALGPFSQNEGKLGKWYFEFPDGTPPSTVERMSYSSIGNPQSFWLAKDHLLQTLREAGFSTIFEQYDFLHHLVDDPYIAENARSMFVAVRDTAEATS